MGYDKYIMKQKKVLIFDFDGVFYSGEHKFDNIPMQMQNAKRDFLPKLSDKEYAEVCDKFPNWQSVTVGADIIDAIYQIKNSGYNVSVDDFWWWQQNNRDLLVIDFGQVIDASYIKQLCKKYAVYVVSNSSYSHLDYYMKILGVKPKWFKKVISNKFCEFDRTKKHYYMSILQKENCEPQNVFVFGDSEISDLVPARELGINACLIENSNDIEQIVQNALK